MNHRAAVAAQIGETLLILQKVEKFLVVVLMNIATPGEPDGKLAKALLRDRETLGRLLTHFAERTELPEDFASELDALLSGRNTFVHSLFMQPWFDLNTPEGCMRLEEFMRTLRSSAKVAMKVMMASITPRDTDAPRTQEAQRYIDSVLERINASVHPEVRALGSSGYVERVATDARANFSVKRREA